MPVITGAHGYLNYGWESSYGSLGANSIDKAFGDDATLRTADKSNQVAVLTGLSQREAKSLLERGFQGGWAVQFIMANPWWLKGLLGDPTQAVDTPSAGLYTYTYDPVEDPVTMQIEHGLDMSTDSVQTFKGCVVNRATISYSVGNPVQVSLSGMHGKEDEGSTLGTQQTHGFEEFTYADGSLEIPNATTQANVQSAELSIINNANLIRGLGSRLPTAATWRNLQIQLSIAAMFEDKTDFLEDFYGGTGGTQEDVSEVADGQLIADNGETGTNIRRIRAEFTGLKHGSISIPNRGPEAEIQERISTQVREVVVDAVNDTSTHP